MKSLSKNDKIDSSSRNLGSLNDSLKDDNYSDEDKDDTGKSKLIAKTKKKDKKKVDKAFKGAEGEQDLKE